ncbi:MlaA family lipoprotein [Arenicella xantha]|uniref:Phospholipid-binding lipoprotein MlaA n=1 Tax=Arenicella xantha TaxID=644221 RepID=A0A395JQ22_9GAMM|nr:VacJ family lipoprotein [Arenicella xantha]RBP53754.1 phospholipid-binding lipoprotein MlaA [Arenicella xantha]
MLQTSANSKFIRLAFIASGLLFLTSCSTLSSKDSPSKHISSDPFERFNRTAFAFNDKADKIVLRPTAKVYDAVLPDPAKKGVSHFFSNLGEPINIINNLLQGKVDGALNSTYRFVVNSTVGVLGLFDVARSYDVRKKPEDFGQTLAAWGVKPGPYIVVPFWGPSNLRDSFAGAASNLVIYPINEVSDESDTRLGLTVLNVINTRARLLDADAVLANQVDPYLFLKTAYESNRVRAIYDGNPPQLDDDDEFDF